MMNGLIRQLSDIVNNYGLPQDFVVQASFYVIAGLACVFAFGVVAMRNIFHCAVSLALCLFCVAGVYLFLNAEFLAIAQVLIYVGAIVTLFIFAIMLTANIEDRSIRQANRQALVSAAVAAAILSFFIFIIIGAPWKAAPEASTADIGPGLENLGRALMSVYALPFEFISLILLAALVGAIVIGKAGRR
ncbi:MAG: NADH-quinone oxidoreductase subunit J [Candidatus Omnitrophica bacterium]|nr:NADH-quinone oxidoreductase subunit J [Candidatus Omnitrophota bacterium]MDD5737829.1 NADH-quinone oxidoreductase subunit J [Candidatus Omnitrophota bacterium]